MTKKLLTLNGLSIICVILYHSAGWGFIAMFWWTHRYLPVSVPNFAQMGTLQYFSLRFLEQLVIFAIPAFLFVSGYFIAFATGKNADRPKWSWLQNRLKFLVVPYLIWAVIMLAFNIIQGEHYTFLEAVTVILTGKATEAYYFIPLLVQLYFLSLLLTPAARKKPLLILLLTGLLMLVVRFGHYAIILNWEFPGKDLLRLLLPSWLFPGNLFWFILGIVGGYHFKKIEAALFRLRYFFLVGIVVLIPIGMLEWEYLLANSGQNWFPPRETIIDNLYALLVLAAFFSFSLNRLVGYKPVHQLGTQSYGIYLSHSLILAVAAKAVYHLVPGILGNMIIFIPLLIISGLIIPLILMAIIRRSPINRWYVYLFG